MLYEFYRSRYLPLNGTIANVVFHDLDLNFQGQTFKLAILTSKRWIKMQTLLTTAIRWEVRYLPLNGATVIVVRHNTDIHLQDHEF